MNAKTVPVTQFRNQCLRLIHEVGSTGEKLIVTKHGRPVAAVIPVIEESGESIFGWSKEIQIHDDLSKPAVSVDDWNIVSDPNRILTGRTRD